MPEASLPKDTLPKAILPKATLVVRKAAIRPEQVVDTVSLDHAARKVGRDGGHRHLTAEGGLGFVLALDRAATLEDGDAVKLDDGRLVAIRAAEEALLEVRAGNPARLMRLAWQLGGSHVPAEVGADLLYVPASAAELVRGGGGTASPVSRPFKPEEAHDHSQCGHDHGHEQGHDHHDHGHDHHHGHGHSHHAHDH